MDKVAVSALSGRKQMAAEEISDAMYVFPYCNVWHDPPTPPNIGDIIVACNYTSWKDSTPIENHNSFGWLQMCNQSM